ncbi:signal peptidase I [Microbacterium xanthum]|uniref:signal peptidase I n=1 Tax=Microbacterium xanthum TaxID=3079794 RepID=UPI002AD1EC5C|nr:MULTISPECIES: signal peptidase I [unclassified Microbacterium]MDZ8172332.1 signal peptidase I [Microbacterium sp. KSW-48]MDZ8201950.1 signal peptidase I [Microbacterium sp. SSW1-59]
MTTEKTGTPPSGASDDAEAVDRRGGRARGWLTFLRDVVIIVLVALLVSFLVKTFLVRSFYIPSGSMEDTLEVDDRILVDEITPRFGEYARGDIVVFQDPGGWLPPSEQPDRGMLVDMGEWLLSLIGLAAPDSDDHLVKRIIGLPGDEVVCCNDVGQITVNGVAIDEAVYLKLPTPVSPASGEEFDVVVPDDSLWVLGDNRYRSKDSRFNQDQPGEGFVPMENLVGRAFLITWPFDRFGTLDFHHEVFAGVPDEPAADSGEGETGE